MLHFLKALSRTVHQCPEELEKGTKNYNNDNYYYDTEDCMISLTVWRKSLIFSCSGFTVIGSDGSLVYRVDNYSGCSDQIVLMDGSGNPIFTIFRRRKLRIVDCSWLVYAGEMSQSCNKSSSKPIFYVRKNTSILEKNSKVLAYVYDGIYDKKCAYTIEGTYTHRMCKILDKSRRVVAEIRRKQDAMAGVSFGLEVFVLSVRPELDSGVAMVIVSLLDQMFS